mmetsp:Transcript_24299/g.81989  ORF Transcript_24299/g.81989 Transcript_24299/m.81989 type:complete len:231 (-) Transcript_24299:44-736(-)
MRPGVRTGRLSSTSESWGTAGAARGSASPRTTFRTTFPTRRRSRPPLSRTPLAPGRPWWRTLLRCSRRCRRLPPPLRRARRCRWASLCPKRHSPHRQRRARRRARRLRPSRNSSSRSCGSGSQRRGWTGRPSTRRSTRLLRRAPIRSRRSSLCCRLAHALGRRPSRRGWPRSTWTERCEAAGGEGSAAGPRAPSGIVLCGRADACFVGLGGVGGLRLGRSLEKVHPSVPL